MHADRTTVGCDRHESVEDGRIRADLVLLAERSDSVDEQDDAGLFRRVGLDAVLIDRPGTGAGVADGALIRYLSHLANQSANVLPIVTVDDRPHVGQHLEGPKALRGEVEAVDVAWAASRGEAGADGDGPQEGRLPTPTGTEHRHVAVGIRLVGNHGLGLVFRVVEDPEHEPMVGPVVRKPRQVVQRTELGHPWPSRLGQFELR